MQSYSFIIVQVVFWMFSLLLWFPDSRSFFSMIFSRQEEKKLCHAAPSHKNFNTRPSLKQGIDRLNTTHKLMKVGDVTLEVFLLFFLTYECYAVNGIQALGASKLFCCHKYFRVPKLGLFLCILWFVQCESQVWSQMQFSTDDLVLAHVPTFAVLKFPP